MRREFRTVVTFFASLAAVTGACGSAIADDAEFSVPLEQQPSGAFYIRGTLNATVETELLVDTGSSYVVLSKATFKALESSESTLFKRTIHGATASGRTVKARVYEVAALAIGDDCVLEAVEVVVLPGSKRDILGLSALERVQPFTFDIRANSLRFSACDADMTTDTIVAAGAPSTTSLVAGYGAPW